MNWSPKQSSKWFADLPRISSIDLSRRFTEDVGSSKAEIGHHPGHRVPLMQLHGTRGLSVKSKLNKSFGAESLQTFDSALFL